jgi:hypothetical protein
MRWQTAHRLISWSMVVEVDTVGVVNPAQVPAPAAPVLPLVPVR